MSPSSASAIGGGSREKKYTSNASSTDRTYANPRAAPSSRARSSSDAGNRKVAVSRSTVGVFIGVLVVLVRLYVRLAHTLASGRTEHLDPLLTSGFSARPVDWPTPRQQEKIGHAGRRCIANPSL